MGSLWRTPVPTPSEMICRKCNERDTTEQHIKTGWCPHCNLFQYEIAIARKHKRGITKSADYDHTSEPVKLDSLIGNIQRYNMSLGEPPRAILFEQFTAANGTLAWRAVVMDGKRVVEYSRRDQLSPQDALRELDLLCKGVSPEDI